MNCLFRRGAARVLVARRTVAPQHMTLTRSTRPFSSVATMPHGEEDHGTFAKEQKYCQTCTCDDHASYKETAVSQPVVVTHPPDDTKAQNEVTNTNITVTKHPCGHNHVDEELPPPLPEPAYSVHKRVMPDNLIALSSPQGRAMLLHALQHYTAESYWSLMEHFSNQSDPAYCGVTTLLIVLNAMSVDPNIRWRGGWRYYGDEDVLLERCCIPHERIRRAGITLTEFARLAKCQGLKVTTKQPTTASVNEFRRDVQEILSSEHGIVVASFARSALGQTGEGHFSPIAAYHEESDYALVLDVARFKYAPYWVSISDLYEAMKPLDEASKEQRGWFVLYPPPFSIRARTSESIGEARRPAHLVPEAKESDICPVGKVKVTYCEASKPKAER